MEFDGATLDEALGKALGTPHRHRLELRAARVARRAARPVPDPGLRLDTKQSLLQRLIGLYPWPTPADRALGEHYLLRRGSDVTLRSIGALDRVQRVAEGHALRRFRAQVLANGRRVGDGPFTDTFERSYPFGAGLESLGRATLSGRFEGRAQALPSGQIRVTGRALIRFSDNYNDPLQIEDFAREKLGLNVSLPNITGRPFNIIDRWTITIDETTR